MIKIALLPVLFLFFFLDSASARLLPGLYWIEAEVVVNPSAPKAVIALPEGATTVALETLNSRGRWVRWSTRAVAKGQRELGMRLPARLASQTWRARAWVPPYRKFPANFYRASHTFGKSPSSGYGEFFTNPCPPWWGSDLLDPNPFFDAFFEIRGFLGLSSVAMDESGDTSSGAVMQEADLWKVEGSTVFFFNQLRGLQVLDLSNPSAPALVCALRLPVVGRDLHILPESGGVRHALLLANDPKEAGTMVVHIVRISGASAEIVTSRKFSGGYVDSRVYGQRLFLATEPSWSSDFLGKRVALLREVFVDSAAGALSEGVAFEMPGFSPVMASGPDWIAMSSAEQPHWNISNVTHVTLFSIAGSGIAQWNSAPIRLDGLVHNKSLMRVREGIFTVFSSALEPSEEVVTNDGSYTLLTPVTRLENFTVAGIKLAGLEIRRDRQLLAARFANHKAYTLSADPADPIRVVDLSDPQAPALARQLEDSGGTAHTATMAPLLFSLALDEGRLAASLFDVSDPANPLLTSQVFLSEPFAAFSESLLDERALCFLEEENLVLVPYRVLKPGPGESGFGIQILEIDNASKTLVPRGRIATDFEPRRTAMVEGAVVAISNNQLLTADLSNPDRPAILADLLLAWPVRRLAASGEALFQIADESTAPPAGGPALRASLSSDPDSILAEIASDGGTVVDSIASHGRLLVLRAENFKAGAAGPALALDVYDVSDPKSPSLEGSSVLELEDSSTGWETGRLLLPSRGVAVVLIRQRPEFPWPEFWEVVCPQGRSSASSDSPGTFVPQGGTARPGRSLAVIFDLASLEAQVLEFPGGRIAALDSAAAADGVMVAGCGDPVDTTRPAPLDFDFFGSARHHHVAILDAAEGRPARWRATLPLPGRLMAATELDRRGFLAWTEETGPGNTRRSLAVSACDLWRVFPITRISTPGYFRPAFAGRSVFFTGSELAERLVFGHRLTDSGRFRSLGSASFDWTPTRLGVLEGELAVLSSQRFAALPVSSFPSRRREWISGLESTDLNNLIPLPKGGFAAPQGDFGVELFR